MPNVSIIRKIIFSCLLIPQIVFASQGVQKLRLGIISVTHSHINTFYKKTDMEKVQVVGVYEPNLDLARRYSVKFGYSMDIVYSNIEEMIAKTKPEAVAVYGSIDLHLKAVEICAPLGIHVMVEKPLALSLKDAKKMESLADKHNIHLLTNYETTWYQSNHKAYEMLHDGKLGPLRKVIVNDGHKGPIEIQVNPEFLTWLTDPKMNGGGAITDFGCYGANLITWLTKGKRPESILAVTQTIKPKMYPKVDDEATIILTYPEMQGVIQASWNWPFSRKDMELYGKTGYVISEDPINISYRLTRKEKEKSVKAKNQVMPYYDPYDLFIDLIRNEYRMPPYDLSSLENNMIVMEILEAAKKSAKTGKRVILK